MADATDSMSAYLFVYGTLRRDTGSAMAQQLERRAAFCGTGACQGRLYSLGRYPGFIPSSHPEEWVQGDLYRMYDPTGLLAIMDDYEGYGPVYPDPNEYLRQLREVQLDDGGMTTAWIYCYNWTVATSCRIRSGDFLLSSHSGQ